MAFDRVGWERFFSELTSFLESCDRQEGKLMMCSSEVKGLIFNTIYVQCLNVHTVIYIKYAILNNNIAGSANENFAEFAVERLEAFIVNICSIVHHLQSNNSSSVTGRIIRNYASLLIETVTLLRSLLSRWQDYLTHYRPRSTFSYSAQAVQSSSPGRPRFEISRAQIQYLRSMSFSWVQISRILGVSYTTIYRRRMEYGLHSSQGTPISDNDLQECLSEMRSRFPALGQTMAWGRLRSLGYAVTRARIREAIRATDPIYTALRWREMTTRRPYSIPSPNSLWHVGL